MAEEDSEKQKNTVSDMETNIGKLETEQARLRAENMKIREQLKEREIKLTSQAEQLNNLEQYTRRNSVRIYGITDNSQMETYTETAKVVVKLISNKLQIPVSLSDIDIAHRLGRFDKNANRPIICKFVSRMKKEDVLKARRKLKGTAVVIREDLTIQNAKMLESVSHNDCVKAAWSDDGKNIAPLKNDKKVVITSRTDIEYLAIQQ